ncbi:MAG: tRNA (adenosine(37)-N6)-dimethylallyltransferase MiaA, partial [Verrucomicrobiota bacterium]
MKPAPPKAFYLAGPTGSGKSALAVELAGRWNGEVVNADAFQIYEDLSILTATPSVEERSSIPHHLYQVLPLEEESTAARFHQMAVETLAGIHTRNRIPIVVGGSGLYMKSLTHGLAELPKGQPLLRERLEELSCQDLERWLRLLDPEGAAATNPANQRYLIRALEICLLTGKKMSCLKNRWPWQPEGTIGAVLRWDRQALYDRINRRTLLMMKMGAAAEVEALRGRSLSSTASKAIGIEPIQQMLRGECDEAETIAAIQMATRRYAKRQTTWFGRETCFQTICIHLGAVAVWTD